MEKQSLTGNCCLINLNTFCSSEGWLEILGINTILPVWSPVRSLTSNTLLCHLVRIPLLPLQTQSAAFKFFSTITGHPILSLSLDGGSVPQLMAFKYSTGQLSNGSSSQVCLEVGIKSTLWKRWSGPGNFARMVSLSLLTVSFVQGRMTRSEQYWFGRPRRWMSG